MSGVCPCTYCAAMRLIPGQAWADIEEVPRFAVGVGVFGVRWPGSKSRYRETIANDNYLGRLPGRHPEASWPRRMPRPAFCVKAREARILVELGVLVKKARVPRLRIGGPDEYRADLYAQACIFVLESTEISSKNALARAERRMRRLYREVAHRRRYEGEL